MTDSSTELIDGAPIPVLSHRRILVIIGALMLGMFLAALEIGRASCRERV